MDANSPIPLIDLARPIDEAGSAIDEACRRIGFFQVINHGVDPAVEDDMWQAAAEFFGLPADAKQAVAIVDGDAYGYADFATERLAASRGDDTPPDLKETFSIGPFEVPSGVANQLAVGADDAARFVYSPNRWPAMLPHLEPTARAYYDQMAGLAGRIMTAMAVGLGLAHDHFESAIDRHASALRILHYPHVAAPAEPGQLRAGAHSDYGTLTLLRQDDAPGGLQVRDVDGTWHDVPARPDAYVVNVGDAMERWTNDRWVSTLHRVAVPPIEPDRDTSRQSIAFFHNANWDASLEALPTCVDADHPARYDPISAGDHLMSKFARTQLPAGKRDLPR